MHNPIACHVQDYFEAACIYQYELAIELINGLKMQGQAQTLKTLEKIEYLVIDNPQGQQLLDLSQIKSVKVLTPNAKFDSIKL